MQTVNIHEAKTHLSRLLEMVSKGEEIIIGKFGKPIAKIVPLTSSKKDRPFGSQKGKMKVSDDFDALPKEIEESFYNSK